MKRVEKGEPPESYCAWTMLANDNWSPSYENLQNPEKAALQRALLTEQGDVCCYCGGRVDADRSHIEHFRPQELYPHLALDYKNLHASCIRETSPGTPLHCGHSKRSRFDETRAISPLEEHCEYRFMYAMDGQILPRDDADHQAAYMIELLDLGNVSLENRRRAALIGAFEIDLTDDELHAIAMSFRSRNSERLLPEFGHVIASCAERYLQIDM